MSTDSAANRLDVSLQTADEVAASADAAAESGQSRLIDSVISATVAAPADRTAAQRASNRLDRFLQAATPADALRCWLGSQAPKDKRQLVQILGRDIAALDALLSDQVNAILHHPRFQELEASWRGLNYLVEHVEEGTSVKVRVLNMSWRELSRDLERAIEFDNSQLFRKIYSEEFGTPGGEPFSVLIGDYQIHPFPSADHRFDDIGTLTGISQVAAAAFAPFISSAHPSMFGLDHYSEMDRPLRLSQSFEQANFIKWRAFRDTEDSRFVGLTLPRILMRTPYEDDGSRVDGFRYQEDVAGPDHRKYLWGNPAYAFAGVLVRSFAESGWLADIRGVQRGIEGGGLVTGLPKHSYSTDKRGLIQKTSTDVVITDVREKELCELGFIPLCDCKDTEFSAFYSNQSVQKPKIYDIQAATMNARISTMLQYMLCVSRFTHYLKVLTRDRVGSFVEARECEDYLQRWISRYVTADTAASSEVKARYPLREARVQVREQPDKPGNFLCVAHLWPHFELDELSAAIRVKSDLASAQQ
jgi:type VI secretion system ImpC/EvpB family protein